MSNVKTRPLLRDLTAEVLSKALFGETAHHEFAYCGPSALQEYFDAKSFRLRGDEPHVTESVLP